MKYKDMLWNGYEEVCTIAKRWGLTRAQTEEFLAYAKALYNSGANDLSEYLSSRANNREPDKEDPAPFADPVRFLSSKRAAVAAR